MLQIEDFSGRNKFELYYRIIDVEDVYSKLWKRLYEHTGIMNTTMPSSDETNYIICVDDEQAVLNQIATQLEEAFGDLCMIEYAESAEEALPLMQEIEAEGGTVRLVISDQVMPGMPGDRFLEIVNKKYPQAHKILLTGYAGLESAMYAINYAGLDKYLEKPWDKDEFLSAVRYLLRTSLEESASDIFRVKDAIQNVLIFRDLAHADIELIAEKLQFVKFSKDTIVFNINDPGDCMYLIKSGEVKVVAGQGDIGEVLAYLGRGNYFGEMALLTGEPRSASVVTAMDSELLKLTKEDFDFLLVRHPSIALTLSHVLSQRLRNVSINRASRQNKIVGILNAIQDDVLEKFILLELARKLIKETHGKVIIVDIDATETQIARLLNLERENTASRWVVENLDTVQEDDLNKILPEDVLGVKFFIPPIREDMSLSSYLIQLLSLLKEFYNFVLVNFRAQGVLDAPAVKTMEQANTILYLLEQSDDFWHKDFPLLQDISTRYAGLLPKIEVMAIRGSMLGGDFSEKLHTLIERHHLHYLRLDSASIQFLFDQVHPKPHTEVTHVAENGLCINRDVGRVARRLGNISVGLVLGGGGARAYAHLGILKVLEEEGIPIDAIAGTSMGAFLGALYITGKSVDEILNISQESWKKLNSPLSWNLPRVAFIKGKRIHNIVHGIFGDTLIEELALPFFCVAGDLVSGQEVVLSRGKLYKAILASGALPAFFEPVPMHNMYLVDGGVVNNVPADVLKDQGIDIVIAVDVTPEREVHLIPSPTISKLPKRGNIFRKLLHLAREVKAKYGTILLPRIIMRVIAIEGLEITRTKAQFFDIHIKPNLQDFDLFDFRKLRQIVEIGEQTGRKELANIRETLDALKR